MLDKKRPLWYNFDNDIYGRCRMKADKKKVLAERSVKYIFILGFFSSLFVMLAVFSIIQFADEGDYLTLILTILSVVLSASWISLILITLLRPRVMIEHDNYGIYLNYATKTVYLRYKDITQALAENERGRGIEYNFGHLTVWAGGERYKIGAIKDVKSVAEFINKKIAWKYSTKRSYRKKY